MLWVLLAIPAWFNATVNLVMLKMMYICQWGRMYSTRKYTGVCHRTSQRLPQIRGNFMKKLYPKLVKNFENALKLGKKNFKRLTKLVELWAKLGKFQNIYSKLG